VKNKTRPTLLFQTKKFWSLNTALFRLPPSFSRVVYSQSGLLRK